MKSDNSKSLTFPEGTVKALLFYDSNHIKKFTCIRFLELSPGPVQTPDPTDEGYWVYREAEFLASYTQSVTERRNAMFIEDNLGNVYLQVDDEF